MAKARKKLEWTFPEYTKQNHSLLWYIIAGIVAGLLLIYALVDGNFLFAVLILAFSVIILFHDHKDPNKVACQLDADGVHVGRLVYEYKDLASFWIMYEPPKTKVLYIEFKNKIKPRFKIPLEDENPLVVREFLLNYLKEDLEQENTPLSDQFSDVLKI
ncbi:MAG: hypothetical protein HOJ15_00290 [Candidatus Jacksonbacteria bacterium]|jgi:hypothetical protein|nr:hypothetical protein [Candidatus Jacksonbacteria bacterium]MBT6034577.1 hypothetical protein [Candidatus Jacksonbacteria bacterium]MBT6300852.1 hypothetical protein [Candidatus Jacksonbacteria bacterium]MBT6757812.1 hypothetical protein [Candidatus Jacksonbacteria bacterium]MBT6955122.1 hypothetical protein [Candidatus Jacksonbacteria bacterium]